MSASHQKITQQHNKLVHLIIPSPHIILQAIPRVTGVISHITHPPHPRDPALWKIITLASGGGAPSSRRMSIKYSAYRWLIAAVKCNLTAGDVRYRRGAQLGPGGALASMAATGQMRGGPVLVRGAIRMQRCGQHWRIVGKCLSVCVRVYQHLSCLFLRCAGCCQGSFTAAGWAPTWCSSRKPPCVSADQNPFIRPQHLLSVSITFFFVKPSTNLYKCRLNPHLTIKALVST